MSKALRDPPPHLSRVEPLMIREPPRSWQRALETNKPTRLILPYTLENLDGLTSRHAEGLRRIQQIVKRSARFRSPRQPGFLQETDLNANIVSTLNLIQGEAAKRRSRSPPSWAEHLSAGPVSPRRIQSSDLEPGQSTPSMPALRGGTVTVYAV